MVEGLIGHTGQKGGGRRTCGRQDGLGDGMRSVGVRVGVDG